MVQSHSLKPILARLWSWVSEIMLCQSSLS